MQLEHLGDAALMALGLDQVGLEDLRDAGIAGQLGWNQKLASGSQRRARRLASRHGRGLCPGTAALACGWAWRARAAGGDVIELLRGFERSNPDASGWILDERGLIRRHINVFVNGERGDERTAVPDGARVDVIPAITGG